MKRKLHTHLDRMLPSVADRVRSKQSQQKATHDYHARERTIEDGQAVYAKDFRYKKTWMPGTVVGKIGPVSARIQFDNGRVVRRHQDHVRVCGKEVVTESVASDIPEIVPMGDSDSVATSPTPGSSDPPDTTAPSAESTESSVNLSPKQSRPLRGRVRPGYLEDYQ